MSVGVEALKGFEVSVEVYALKGVEVSLDADESSVNVIAENISILLY